MRLPNLLVAFSLLSSSLLSSTLAAVGTPGKSQRKKPQVQRPDTKYFKEPGGGEVLGHYDSRYYLGEPVSYEEHHDALQHLIRSYLTTFRARNIETWIAHGSLLGWWWNGKIMPWDSDLDVQVSGSTMMWLAENLNMTMHNYTSATNDGPGAGVNKTYLLDVNPNQASRVRGDGMNVIDARWIDVQNGLFIDITALSETNPAAQPGVWSCKNYHRYRTRDLYPLRETVFEGVPALVPYSFDKILTEEYSARALTKTLHEGHRWLPQQKEWVKEPDRPNVGARSATIKPHVPRSIEAESKPRAGLGNLLRIL